MTRNVEFPHKFVELIPRTLDERVLYVSMEHAVAVHLCACGCGRKVVTPLAPIHWKLTFDGRSVTLTPSIGNHAFPCKSHYWLEGGKVRWSYEMSPEAVENVRASAKRLQRKFYGLHQTGPDIPSKGKTTPNIQRPLAVKPRPWWRRLLGDNDN